jgi:hypothetical protein
MNYGNPRSVTNRINQIKKKYDLPFGSSASTKTTAAKSGDSGGEAKIPLTPTKNRVTKTKTPKRGLATPMRKAKAGAKYEFSEEEDEINMSDAKDKGKFILC